jgi:hypothetical protein
MEKDLMANYGFRQVPFALLQRLGTIARKKAPDFLQKQCAAINATC